MHNLFATTNYVSKTGEHISPFNSWVNAATNIQAAVDAAYDGETVLVTNGIYNTGSAITPGYSCFNRVVITNHITITSVNGPESTIILGRGPLGSNAVRGVYMSAGVLDGFTLSNGHTIINGDEAFDICGGGVNLYDGSGIITNSIIIGNSAVYGGGTCFGTVNNCIISGNLAKEYGGGALFGKINNCIISENLAGHEGGGAYESTINNCSVSGNSAEFGGGTSDSTVDNCTISGNSAGIYGGGTSRSKVNNCIIWDNYSPIYSNYYDCLIYYSCTYPLPVYVGNFTNNPVLLSASHISPYSPCIRAGSNTYTIGKDIDGESWKNPPSIGCDEVYTNNLTGKLLVNIYAKYTSAVVGTGLKFKAIISGKPVSNYWTFGDGAITADKYIVEHFFTNTGKYEIVLSVFNIDNTAGVSATVTVNLLELENSTYYVNKANTSSIYPYKSWITAAANIQDGVNSAIQSQIKGALVLVTNGVYDTGETVIPRHSSSNRVVITEDIVVKSINGPENTIILGNGPLGNGAVRCVYMSAGILDGFIISNGHTIKIGNWYYDIRGGGVSLCGGNGILKNCIISGNSALYGGGIYYGTIYNSIICDNSANNGGGTFDTIVNNCTISKNSAVNDGGGTYDSTVNNSIIYYNFATNYFNRYKGSYNYCCATPDSTNGTGNISTEPQFISTSDFHLQETSPCIDAGTNMNWMWTATDLDGNPRIIGGIVDMGAYEFVPEPGILWIIGLLKLWIIVKYRILSIKR